VLVGRDTGPDNGCLMQMLESSGVARRFHLLGEREDVNRITSGFDIACSASYGEGFPNAVGEACGVP
jgi:hypothetical protein